MSASYMRKYGTGTGADIYINIPKAGSANHAVSADWTPAAGDVKISKDGGVAANIGTLPTAVAMGNSAIWKFVFTDAELQAAFVSVTVSDSATKAVDDTGFSIETYGNASAQHAFDLDTASTAQTGDSFARLGAPAGASLSADVAAVKTQTGAIETDTQDIQARLPAALTAGGNIKADALLLNGAAPNNVAATDIVSSGAITTSGGIASADVKKINNVTITGDGSATPFNVA